MLTIVLSSPPDSEMFDYGLSMAMAASDGAEPVQVLIHGVLLLELSRGSRTFEADLAAKRLCQLELFEVPTYAVKYHDRTRGIGKPLQFIRRVDPGQYYHLLKVSDRVLSF